VTRDVEAVTVTAVDAVADMNAAVPEAAGRGRAALSTLPGLANGDDLASASLYAAGPNRRRSTTGACNAHSDFYR
jgi:hypothetical protein